MVWLGGVQCRLVFLDTNWVGIWLVGTVRIYPGEAYGCSLGFGEDGLVWGLLLLGVNRDFGGGMLKGVEVSGGAREDWCR